MTPPPTFDTLQLQKKLELCTVFRIYLSSYRPLSSYVSLCLCPRDPNSWEILNGVGVKFPYLPVSCSCCPSP